MIPKVGSSAATDAAAPEARPKSQLEFARQLLARPPWMEEATLAERLGRAIVLTLIALAVLYPFVAVLATSLASDQDIAEGGGMVLIPWHPSLNAYETIFHGGVISHAVLVSIGVTAVGTLLSLIVTVAMAYGLSRPIVARRPLLLVVLCTLFFVPGIIPNYLVVKQLGLLNNYAALILPVLINTFNLIVVRQFFLGIPQELIDSARIDGAGDVSILIRIMLPLSKAVIAVIALFYAVFYWNNFFTALLYLNDAKMWPLTLIVRLYVLQGARLPGTGGAVDAAPPPAQAIQMAVVLVAVLPILVVYPFLQKYFTRGVLSGAIKG